MQKYQVDIMNNKKQIQKFHVEEYGDYVVLIQYFSNDISFIEIPSQINNKKVTIIGDSCFFNHPEIVGVSVPSTIISIGNGAFALCKGIKELYLPDSITEIGVYAFRDCTELKKVVMPKHLKVLSAGIFAFCYLTEDVEIILPGELEKIETHAFYSGGSFDLKIPNTVKKIGVGAFNWGPKIITSLPYDKGWYLDWPYGEEVLLKDGMVGLVTDIKELGNNCEVLQVEVNGTIRNLFYPCFNKVDFEFSEERNQRLMEEAIRDSDGLEGAYEEWLNGLI